MADGPRFIPCVEVGVAPLGSCSGCIGGQWCTDAGGCLFPSLVRKRTMTSDANLRAAAENSRARGISIFAEPSILLALLDRVQAAEADNERMLQHSSRETFVRMLAERDGAEGSTN